MEHPTQPAAGTTRPVSRTRVAVHGHDAATPAVLARLAARRNVAEIQWVSGAAQTVANPKVRWIETTTGAALQLQPCDVLVLLAPAESSATALETLLEASRQAGVTHVVSLWTTAATHAPIIDAWASGEGRGATHLHAGLVVGPWLTGPWRAALQRRSLPRVPGSLEFLWDEDLADAIAQAVGERPSGTFALRAGEPQPADRLAASLGWPLASPVEQTLPPPLDVPPLPGWQPRFSGPEAVLRRYAASVPVKLDRRLALLFRLLALFGRGKPNPAVPELRVGLHLTGADGGTIGLVLRGPSLRVVPGPMRAPNATLTLSAGLFRGLLAGTASMPTAQLTGRVRIDGDPFAIALVGSICQMLQKQAAGPLGSLVRPYLRWLAQEAEA